MCAIYLYVVFKKNQLEYLILFEKVAGLVIFFDVYFSGTLLVLNIFLGMWLLFTIILKYYIGTYFSQCLFLDIKLRLSSQHWSFVITLQIPLITWSCWTWISWAYPITAEMSYWSGRSLWLPTDSLSLTRLNIAALTLKM